MGDDVALQHLCLASPPLLQWLWVLPYLVACARPSPARLSRLMKLPNEPSLPRRPHPLSPKQHLPHVPSSQASRTMPWPSVAATLSACDSGNIIIIFSSRQQAAVASCQLPVATPIRHTLPPHSHAGLSNPLADSYDSSSYSYNYSSSFGPGPGPGMAKSICIFASLCLTVNMPPSADAPAERRAFNDKV